MDRLPSPKVSVTRTETAFLARMKKLLNAFPELSGRPARSAALCVIYEEVLKNRHLLEKRRFRKFKRMTVFKLDELVREHGWVEGRKYQSKLGR